MRKVTPIILAISEIPRHRLFNLDNIVMSVIIVTPLIFTPLLYNKIKKLVQLNNLASIKFYIIFTLLLKTKNKTKKL